jgi:ATP-binding cassette, subfamily A (ABC1), member 3
LMIISLLLPLSNVIKVLVEEKETKMRESMMMMALRSDSLWLTWIMHFMLLFLPLSIILTLASRQLFTYSNPAYIFIYFMVFFISSTSYGIFISTLFSKSRTGKTMSS